MYEWATQRKMKMKITKSQLKQIIKEELNEVLWKIEYNTKDEPRPATGKQEKGKHTKNIEAASAEEAQRDLVKAGHHVVKTSEVEKEDKE
jgi:hypothetical protein